MVSEPLSQFQDPRTGVKSKIVIPLLRRRASSLCSRSVFVLANGQWVYLFSVFLSRMIANPFSRLKERLADWREPGHIPWENSRTRLQTTINGCQKDPYILQKTFLVHLVKLGLDFVQFGTLKKENWRDAHMGSRAEAGSVALTIVRYERNGGVNMKAWG